MEIETVDGAELAKQLGRGPYVKVEVAAKFFGVPAEKLRQVRARGAFPGSIQLDDKASCHWLIPVPAIREWLEAREKAGHVVPREQRVRGQVRA